MVPAVVWLMGRAKVSKGEILAYFNEVFDALSKAS